MTATPRWGITLPLRSMPLDGQRDIVAALPDLGYTDAWSSELNGADAFTPLALVAQWTDRLRLGTAIAGIYTRGPALLAMNAATMAALAPGRFVLGIGTSSPVIVEAWNGIELARPYQRARDTLLFLRAALAGEKVSAGYESFAISGFRLDPPPAQPPGLALAALRPGMVRLAASLADGAITNWLAPSDVRMPASPGRSAGGWSRPTSPCPRTPPSTPGWAAARYCAPCRTRGRPGTARGRSPPSPTTSWTSWSCTDGRRTAGSRSSSTGPAAWTPRW